MTESLRSSLKTEFSIKIIKVARAAHRSSLVRRVLGKTHARQFAFINRMYRAVYLMGQPRKATTIEAKVHGMRIRGPAWDNTILPALVAGYYEEFEVAIFRQLAAKSRGVVDVGANIGLYTCIAAAASPDSRVLAFEPVPENYHFLLDNVNTNGVSARVLAEMQAVGEREGELVLHLSNRQIGTHSASAENTEECSGTTIVPMTDLDSYLKTHDMPPVDLMKIDIEGYDGFALRGAVATLRKDRPTIFIEFNPSALSNCGFEPHELLELIAAHGYHIFIVDLLDSRLIECQFKDVIDVIEEDAASKPYLSNLLAVSRAEHLEALSPWLPFGDISDR